MGIDIHTLIGEATAYDKKQMLEIKRPKSWLKSVSAFANGEGVYRQGVFSDYYLEDGSFLKLDNITLGYNFHFKENKYVEGLRLYLTGENLFTITSYSGIDPEVNTTSVWDCGIDATGFYPSIMNVMFGVNITLL